MMLLSVLFLNLVGATHEQVCSAAAHLGRWWYNDCKQRCVCEQLSSEFVWNCYRERKEFACMDSAERTLFIKTYKNVSSPGPQYSQYQALIARHTTEFAIIHTSQYFLPWHRWFVMELENLLQNVNCKVTIPWWDTAKNAGSPWSSSPWGASPDLLGTAGACVTDGGFASPDWPNNAHGCLSRTLSGTLPSSIQEANVLAMTPSNYVAFTDALETQVHNVVHVRIGGTMAQGWSPEAPEFFLHHSHIDKLWNDWQLKSSTHLNSYPFSTTTAMPVAMGATAGQYRNLKSTGVMYTRFSANSLGSGHTSSLDPCNLVQVAGVSIAVTDLQTAITSANSTTLLGITQLPAPVLTTAEENMMIDMVKKGRGTNKQITAFARKLTVGRQILEKYNENLKARGSLGSPSSVQGSDLSMETTAGTSSKWDFGIDLEQAVKLLGVRPAQ